MSESDETAPKPAGSDYKKPNKKLTLVVDKTRFICNSVIFNHHPTTLLGKMFSPQMLRPGTL